jgi:hypothetical protein
MPLAAIPEGTSASCQSFGFSGFDRLGTFGLGSFGKGFGFGRSRSFFFFLGIPIPPAAVSGLTPERSR